MKLNIGHYIVISFLFSVVSACILYDVKPRIVTDKDKDILWFKLLVLSAIFGLSLFIILLLVFEKQKYKSATMGFSNTY